MLKKLIPATIALTILNLHATYENIKISDFFEKTETGYRLKRTHYLEEAYMEALIEKAGRFMMLREAEKNLECMEKIEKKYFEYAQKLGLCD